MTVRNIAFGIEQVMSDNWLLFFSSSSFFFFFNCFIGVFVAVPARYFVLQRFF